MLCYQLARFCYISDNRSGVNGLITIQFPFLYQISKQVRSLLSHELNAVEGPCVCDYTMFGVAVCAMRAVSHFSAERNLAPCQ